ncbi:hypothetical protein PCANB_001067 [Pneumocystis canis]|nr:hypothetical protein PCANB_001067 [Pneumocystis canis]
MRHLCVFLLSPPKRLRSSFSESTLHKRQEGLEEKEEIKSNEESKEENKKFINMKIKKSIPEKTHTALFETNYIMKDWMNYDEKQEFTNKDFKDTLYALDMLTSDDRIINENEKINTFNQKIPNKNEQKMIIETFLEIKENPNEKWYIIAKPWMKKYRAYLQENNSEITFLEPIDQTYIMVNNHLKYGLIEGKDFEIISSTVWHYLVTWFGLKGQAFLKDAINLQTQEFDNISTISKNTNNEESISSYVFQLIRMKKKSTKMEKPGKEFKEKISINDQEIMTKQSLLSPITAVVSNHHYDHITTMEGLDETENDEIDDEPFDWPLNQAIETEMQTRLLATPPINSSPIHLTIRGDTDISTFFKSIRQVLKLNPTQRIRLWHEGKQVITSETILPQETNVKTLGLPLVSELFIEILDETSSVSHSPLLLETMPSSKALSYMYDKEQSDCEPSTLLNIQAITSKIKAIGLQNLGNSCYMNAALQCLTHTKELTTYFLSGMYRWEVNPTNPLGTGGQMARSYATLLNSLAHTTTTSFSPKAFKNCIGRFNLSFAGHSQQDSQELLAFLLDGMHEDLNRIQKKPYFEKPTLSDMNDALIAETANICWELHRKRNDSVIVDLFHGLYKSVLVCPICDQVSITFDPFMDLTLPLPFKNQWTYTVTVIPSNIEKKQIQITVELETSSTIAAMKAHIASKLGMDAHSLISSEIYAYKFYKHHSDANIVSAHLSPHDQVYLYEMPCSISDFTTNRHKIIIPVFHQKIEKAYRHPVAFGIPFFILLTSEEACSYDLIVKKIVEKYKQFIGSKEIDQNKVQQTVHHEHDVMSTMEFFEGETTENDFKKENSPQKESFDLKYFSSRHSILPTGWSAPMDHLPRLKTRFGKNTNTDKSFDEDALLTAESEDEPFSHGTPISLDDMIEDSDFSITKDSSDDELLPSNPILTKTNQMSLKQEHRSQISSELNIQENRIPKNSKAYIHQGEAIVCEWSADHYASIFSNETEHDPRSSSVWDNVEKYEDPSLSNNYKPSAIHLNDCLDLFAKKEQLGEDDLWYCPNCKEHRRATKQLEIWKSPDILVIHLKRFSSSRNLRDKIDVLVDFPLKGLDLSQRVAENKYGSSLTNDSQIYDLYAVNNHFGGLGGGHYTAYVASENGYFYHFDDSLVVRIHESQIVTPAAYLLFYRRRTDKVLGEFTMNKITEYMSKIPTEPYDKINITSSLNKVSDLTMSDEKFILDPCTASMPNMPSSMTHIDLSIRTPDDSINSNSQDSIESEKITFSDGFDYNDKGEYVNSETSI